MALTVITMTPVLAFYPFFQKYFVKGIDAGARSRAKKKFGRLAA